MFCFVLIDCHVLATVNVKVTWYRAEMVTWKVLFDLLFPCVE